MQLQKYLEPRRHSPQERRLRYQAINLTPPRRVKTWGDGTQRLEELIVRHEASARSLCTKQGLIKLPSYSQCETYIGSLTLAQIRQINLPVSLHLPETYRFMPLLGLVLLQEIVSFSGFIFFPCLSPVFFSPGDLDLPCTKLLSRSYCII